MALIGKFAAKAAIVVGAMGLVVSRVSVLRWLNGESALVAFVLWYALFYVWIILAYVFLFGHIDPRIFRVSLGITLIGFALGIVLYWPASDYALQVVGANPSGTPSFLLATEDQVTLMFWSGVGVSDTFLLGILTYVITPIALILVAAMVITPTRFKNAIKALL